MLTRLARNGKKIANTPVRKVSPIAILIVGRINKLAKIEISEIDPKKYKSMGIHKMDAESVEMIVLGKKPGFLCGP